jgi:hypothetical protein
LPKARSSRPAVPDAVYLRPTWRRRLPVPDAAYLRLNGVVGGTAKQVRSQNLARNRSDIRRLRHLADAPPSAGVVHALRQRLEPTDTVWLHGLALG